MEGKNGCPVFLAMDLAMDLYRYAQQKGRDVYKHNIIRNNQKITNYQVFGIFFVHVQTVSTRLHSYK